jgi:long-chain acyl-CoA synthetase
MVLTAQNFIIHLQPPPGLFWKTLELVPPSNPFSHLSRFATLLRNGVLGFPNQASDWESNLRILRPTLLFASRPELESVVAHVEKIAQRPGFKARTTAGGRIDQARAMLSSNRALKLPEAVFDAAGRVLRMVSRFAVGETFVDEAVGQLRCVVHGLAPAQESHVRCLERIGVPVVETYGVTAAAGLLSSNTFEAPHFNLIGSPLPHVSFRLGAHSLLEYKLATSVFKDSGVWQETGDVAQMTPFGFAITGRKKHLFVTAGGVTVSPVRLEGLFKEHEIIADACVVGDKMPYLAALIVLSPQAYADYQARTEEIKERVQDIVTAVNETLSRFATIKKFVVLDKPFLEQDGEKLSSGSLNRLKIYETRRALIENLYRTA